MMGNTLCSIKTTRKFFCGSDINGKIIHHHDESFLEMVGEDGIEPSGRFRVRFTVFPFAVQDYSPVKNSRAGTIRTSDLMLPRHVGFQAPLQPDGGSARNRTQSKGDLEAPAIPLGD